MFVEQVDMVIPHYDDIVGKNFASEWYAKPMDDKSLSSVYVCLPTDL